MATRKSTVVAPMKKVAGPYVIPSHTETRSSSRGDAASSTRTDPAESQSSEYFARIWLRRTSRSMKNTLESVTSITRMWPRVLMSDRSRPVGAHAGGGGPGLC